MTQPTLPSAGSTATPDLAAMLSGRILAQHLQAAQRSAGSKAASSPGGKGGGSGGGTTNTQSKTCKPTRNPCCKPTKPPQCDTVLAAEGTQTKTCKPTRNPCCKAKTLAKWTASSSMSLPRSRSGGRAISSWLRA